MPVEPKELQRLIIDYQRWTGKKVTRFVCPILNEECNETDLINGHIINESLKHVPKKTIIQYGKIDGFYGTRTEAAFVHFINLRFTDRYDRMAKSDSLFVVLPDGSEIEAFLVKGSTPLPCLNISEADGHFRKIYLRTRNDDPRLKDPRNSTPIPNRPGEYKATAIPRIKMGEGPFVPTQWAASALKIAYLTDFHLRGYGVLVDPYMQVVRAALRDYFLDDGRVEDCPKYFRKFRHAVRYLASPDADAGLVNLKENSIEHQTALLHFTSRGQVFGLSFVLPIRNIEFLFTVPHGDQFSDPSQVMDEYWRFVQTEHPEEQSILKAKYRDQAWRPEPQIWRIRFPKVPPDDC